MPNFVYAFYRGVHTLYIIYMHNVCIWGTVCAKINKKWGIYTPKYSKYNTLGI